MGSYIQGYFSLIVFKGPIICIGWEATMYNDIKLNELIVYLTQPVRIRVNLF